jgi:DNA-binding transcriptional regulator YiaG
VEAHYPVEWNWERGHFLNFKIPESLLETARKGEDPFKTRTDEVAKMAQDLTAAASSPAILSQLTHGVAVKVKEGQEDEIHLPPEEEKEWAALKTDEERDAYLDKVREPFSIGGIETFDKENGNGIIIQLDHVDIKGEDAPPPLIPETIKKLRDLPSLLFNIEDEGRELKGSVVIMVHPLVIDEDKHETYFPVVVGLVFSPPEIKEGEEAVMVNPATWAGDEEKQKTFFKELWELLLEKMPRKLAGEEEAPEPSKLVPVGALSPERRHLLNRSTKISREAALVKSSMRGLRLPKKWGDIKRWEDLVKEKVKRLSEELGDEAYQDLRAETGDPNAHGPLLERRFKNNAEVVELTREARENLLAEVGPKGFRERVQDADGPFREYIIKRLPVRGGSGYMEARISWYGQAWPLVDQGRNERKEVLEAARKSLPSLPFDDLVTKEKEIVNSYLRMWESIRDARLVMDLILHKFGAVGENPLKVYVWELKSLLLCENDPHGFRRIKGALRALEELRFNLKASGVHGLSNEISGPFIKGDSKFTWKGAGAHTDGFFEVEISGAFVGSLKVFNVDHKIRDPYKIFEAKGWGKKLSKEEKKMLKDEAKAGGGYIQRTSSISPFFDRAKGFSDNQSNLFLWIDDNITKRKDPTKKKGPFTKTRSAAKDADEPRLYGRETCPLLPEGQLFHGALGRYKPRPEQGRRLFGTPTRGSEKSGGHAPGLLMEMGYQLPPGQARAKREEIKRKALQDLHVVVEETFGGIVAGKRGENWVTLKDAESLPVDVVLKSISWFIFLPTTWRKKIPQDVEAFFAARLAKGETPYQVKVTEDRRVHESSETSKGLSEETVGLGNEPLWIRLYATRRERKISQATVGEVFGVSQPIVAGWEKGPEEGKPIPADVAALLSRWIENGPPPSEEELEALRTRRSVRPGVEKE